MKHGTNQPVRFWANTKKKTSWSKPKALSSNATSDKALAWKSVSCQGRISPPMEERQESWWVWPTLRCFTRREQSFSLALLQEEPAGLRIRAMGSTHKRTSLFSTGNGTTAVLEAIAEQNENWAFTPTESLSFRPGTLTGLRCNTLIRSQYCPSGTRLKPQTDFQQTA